MATRTQRDLLAEVRQQFRLADLKARSIGELIAMDLSALSNGSEVRNGMYVINALLDGRCRLDTNEL
ncbi:MAG: hypothetical protein AAGG56_12315 [Pseudomonadota bacterium]